MTHTDPASRYRSLRLEYPAPHIAEIILTGPGRGNAMGPDTWRELPQAVAEIESRPDLRAAIVRGEGRHFSTGLDLEATGQDLAPLLNRPALAFERDRLLGYIRSMQAAFAAVADARVPFVAAVHGWCIGAGLELIAACDLRLCAADARFSLREVRLAIASDLGGIQRLPYLIGEGRARDLALTGRDVDAAWAERAGLVSEVLETPEQTVQAARDLAARLATNPPLTVGGIKRLMNARLEDDLRRGLREAAAFNAAYLQSEDYLEAQRALAERREPQFKGK
ncbi:enoyl-CoA hydratase [Deinobacterium chartae]|uniref:Enoyl-CoA hydratase n=1 Tax=Deinobacterium chartae TaxID=521158 RepID=A0A841HZ16_9DEIO|nr:enoyl-CoA hydratase-related protein [Deinobacterium chartae]MBB6098781.1 enoyl-CoA hydratase [Deinobacterium chartae]